MHETSTPLINMLVLSKRDPARNVARFYVLRIEQSMFGDTALVRNWGRLGLIGREIRSHHPTTASALESLDVWLRRKQRRGYTLVHHE